MEHTTTRRLTIPRKVLHALLALVLAVGLLPVVQPAGEAGAQEREYAAEAATYSISCQNAQNLESLDVYVDGVLTYEGASSQDALQAPAGSTVWLDFHYADGYGAAFDNLYVVNANSDDLEITKAPIGDGHDARVGFTMPAQAVRYYANSSRLHAVSLAEGLTGGHLETSSDLGSSSEHVIITAVPDEGWQLNSMSVSRDGGATWAECSGIDGNVLDAHGMLWTDCLFSATFVRAASEALVVSTEEELRAFAARVSAGETFAGMTVELGADIALTQAWQPAGYRCQYSTDGGSLPMLGSTACSAFKGTFDGKGHKITGLRVEGASAIAHAPGDAVAAQGSAGLFGWLDGATVRDVTLYGEVGYAQCDLLGYEEYGKKAMGNSFAGAVCGYVQNSTVSGVISYVDVSGDSGYVGGICGWAEGSTLDGCLVYGAVTADETGALSKYGREGTLYAVGGVVGYLQSGGVSRCASYALVKFELAKDPEDAAAGALNVVNCRYYAGGVVGYVSDSSTVSQCAAKGGVDGSANYQGGVVGASLGSVFDCYSTGDVVNHAQNYRKGSFPYAGGAVGIVGSKADSVNLGGKPLSSFVDRVYATGSVIVDSNPDFYRLGSTLCAANRESGTYSDCCSTSELIAASYWRNLDGVALYDSTDTFTAADLGDAFKEDVNGVNGGHPLLAWESGEADAAEHAVTFAAVDAEGGSALSPRVTVYSDEARTQAVAGGGSGAWSLRDGKYFYTAELDGYLPVKGSLTVAGRDCAVALTMRRSALVTFGLSPAGTALSVTGAFAQLASSDEGGATYLLAAGYHYTYEATAAGRNGVMREFDAADGMAVDVSLTESGWAADGAITGGAYISGGGTYCLAAAATGTITVATSEPVTLVGTGTDLASMRSNLYVDCSGQESHLTLRDVYIRNTSSGTAASGNMVNFANGCAGNTLTFAGCCVCDYDGNAAGYAMFHVPDGSGLTVDCTEGDWSYVYKREQGAGFGGNGGASGGEGQAAETNGDITFDGARLFMKNSKQGALIGAGAQAGTQEPGAITIRNSELVLVAISRGAAIGGSAGSGGASSGSSVLVEDSSLTINVDYSGSAIGGGGFASGNDSDGGTLTCVRSSVRAYIDYNAVDPSGNGLGDPSDSLWAAYGVTMPGVNGNAAVTARVQNANGEDVALCQVDTLLAGVTAGGNHVLLVDGEEAYRGGLHVWKYVNESLQKDAQVSITYTLDNWVALDDPDLYVYLTPADHELELDGVALKATWHEATETAAGYFTVEKAGDPVYDHTRGDVNDNGSVNVVDAQIVLDMACGVWDAADAQIAAGATAGKYGLLLDALRAAGVQWNLATLTAAADANLDGTVDALDARAVQSYVHAGAWGASRPAVL